MYTYNNSLLSLFTQLLSKATKAMKALAMATATATDYRKKKKA